MWYGPRNRFFIFCCSTVLSGVNPWSGNGSHTYLADVEGDSAPIWNEIVQNYCLLYNMVTKSLLMSHQNEAQLSVLLIHFVLSMSCIWGCEEMHFHKINYGQKTSMSPIPTTTGSSNGLFYCGLLCRNNPGCRALMRMNSTTIEAGCNQEPGLLQPFTVYILQKEVAVSGKI